jgi:hypothetical protein
MAPGYYFPFLSIIIILIICPYFYISTPSLMLTSHLSQLDVA